MVVCHCELVNDRTIREIAAGRITDVAEVTARCGAGGHCGGCRPSIERLLRETVEAAADTSPSPRTSTRAVRVTTLKPHARVA